MLRHSENPLKRPDTEEKTATEAYSKRDDLFRKKLLIVDEIKERVQKNQSGTEICKAKMAQMLQNVAKNSNAARVKIKEQIQELRNRPNFSQHPTKSTVCDSSPSREHPEPLPNKSCKFQVPYRSTVECTIPAKNFLKKPNASMCVSRKMMEEPRTLEWDGTEELQIIRTLNENDNEMQYDDSLFNIIDEIEANEAKPPSPAHAISRSRKEMSIEKGHETNPYESKVYYPRVQSHTLYGYK